jgi:hypothetical protein
MGVEASSRMVIGGTCDRHRLSAGYFGSKVEKLACGSKLQAHAESGDPTKLLPIGPSAFIRESSTFFTRQCLRSGIGLYDRGTFRIKVTKLPNPTKSWDTPPSAAAAPQRRLLERLKHTHLGCDKHEDHVCGLHFHRRTSATTPKMAHSHEEVFSIPLSHVSKARCLSDVSK